jgi:hypothetical protein
LLKGAAGVNLFYQEFCQKAIKPFEVGQNRVQQLPPTSISGQFWGCFNLPKIPEQRLPSIGPGPQVKLKRYCSMVVFLFF